MRHLGVGGSNFLSLKKCLVHDLCKYQKERDRIILLREIWKLRVDSNILMMEYMGMHEGVRNVRLFQEDNWKFYSQVILNLDHYLAFLSDQLCVVNQMLLNDQALNDKVIEYQKYFGSGSGGD